MYGFLSLSFVCFTTGFMCGYARVKFFVYYALGAMLIYARNRWLHVYLDDLLVPTTTISTSTVIHCTFYFVDLVCMVSYLVDITGILNGFSFKHLNDDLRHLKGSASRAAPFELRPLFFVYVRLVCFVLGGLPKVLCVFTSDLSSCVFYRRFHVYAFPSLSFVCFTTGFMCAYVRARFFVYYTLGLCVFTLEALGFMFIQKTFLFR